MLYLVATPIGHLKDFSLRAIETLNSCDYILCEDTRVTSHLLHHHEIKTPLKSFHDHNETRKENFIVQELREGRTIALVSDAGTPCLQDPGARLVARLRLEGLKVTSLPGPSAVINALILSGLPTAPFQFLGYVPKDSQDRVLFFLRMFSFVGTSICFETPHRIEKTLQELAKIEPHKVFVLLREMTKTFEEYLQGTAEELLTKSPRGEYVLLSHNEEQASWEDLNDKELFELFIQTFGLKEKDALKAVSQLKNKKKQDLYQQLIVESP